MAVSPSRRPVQDIWESSYWWIESGSRPGQKETSPYGTDPSALAHHGLGSLHLHLFSSCSVIGLVIAASWEAPSPWDVPSHSWGWPGREIASSRLLLMACPAAGRQVFPRRWSQGVVSPHQQHEILGRIGICWSAKVLLFKKISFLGI